MDFRYEIGDAVVVRSDLNDGTNYYMRSGDGADGVCSTFCDMMPSFAGKVVHISDYTWSDEYRIEEDGELYHWTDEMFVGLAGNGVNFHSLL